MRRRDTRRFGRLGLRELLEPELRRVTAELFGITEAWLTPDVSFEHDLAADSLDLAELVVAIEPRLQVTIPGHAIDRVRTYGDLVDLVVECRLPRGSRSGDAIFVRASIEPGHRDGRGVVERSAWLTPYSIEIIEADARRSGPGTKLTIRVPAAAPLADAQRVERSFAHLAAAGVTLDVQHEHPHQRRAVA